MKVLAWFLLINISFQGISNVNYYQDDRLVGFEKYNDSNQIICEYGYIIDAAYQNKLVQEYEQYFYDSLGRLKIKVKGEYLSEAEILSYSYEENVLVKITDHVKNNNWFYSIPFFYFPLDSTVVYSNSYSLISDTLFYNDSIIQNEIKQRDEVKKWEKTRYKFGDFETFYAHYMLEQIKHSSWDEQVYDFETGTFQVIHYSDCAGYGTGIYYPVEQAYLETEYDTLSRKKRDFVYTLDDEYTRDVERFYKYNKFNSVIVNEGVLRGFDEVDYDTIHRHFERYINYKYDEQNRLVNKKAVNYKDSVLNELILRYNSNGDTIAKMDSHGNDYMRYIKYNLAGKPKRILTENVLLTNGMEKKSNKSRIIWNLKYNRNKQLIKIEESISYSEEPEITHQYRIEYI